MRNRKSVTFVMMMMLALVSLMTVACKSSGMAVTKRGQVLAINISNPEDLADGATETLKVSVDNRGVANVSNVEFTVELPNELVVLSEKHGDGMDLMEMRSPNGTKIFHYRVGDIEATTSSKAEFQVRTAFGTLDRTGDIKVTAWAGDLPGDKLLETRMIKLRR